MFTMAEMETLHADAVRAGLTDFEAWGCVMTAQADTEVTGAFDFARIITDALAERSVRAGLAAKWEKVQGDTAVIFDEGWNETEAA